MTVTLHDRRGEYLECPVGFSWTVLFFGFLVPLFRRDGTWFFIMLLLSGSSIGLFDLVFAFKYNKIYIKKLLNKGFLPASDRDDLILQEIGVFVSPPPDWER